MAFQWRQGGELGWGLIQLSEAAQDAAAATGPQANGSEECGHGEARKDQQAHRTETNRIAQRLLRRSSDKLAGIADDIHAILRLETVLIDGCSNLVP